MNTVVHDTIEQNNTATGVAAEITIDAVYFAQTHVLEPHHPYFRLVGGRNALIKVHALSGVGIEAPPVTVSLELDEESTEVALAFHPDNSWDIHPKCENIGRSQNLQYVCKLAT